MGVKTTVTLTREDAEYRYVSLRQDEMERKLRAEAVALNDTELENILEEKNDEANDGEGFENYLIEGN